MVKLDGMSNVEKSVSGPSTAQEPLTTPGTPAAAMLPFIPADMSATPAAAEATDQADQETETTTGEMIFPSEVVGEPATVPFVPAEAGQEGFSEVAKAAAADQLPAEADQAKADPPTATTSPVVGRDIGDQVEKQDPPATTSDPEPAPEFKPLKLDDELKTDAGRLGEKLTVAVAKQKAETEHDRRVADASAKVAEAAVAMATAQAEVKTTKKEFDAAVDRLLAVISDRPAATITATVATTATPELYPKPATDQATDGPTAGIDQDNAGSGDQATAEDFGDNPVDDGQAAPESTSGGQATEAATDPSPSIASDDEDAWRSDSVEILGLSSGILKSLNETGITTLGEMADWLGPEDRDFVQIKGIGQGKADKINDAYDRYWEAWREKQNTK